MTLAFGVSYYPEHWLHLPDFAIRQASEIKLMQAAGFNTIRLGEFAWSTLEPSPGEFNFGWLHDSIDALAAAGMKIVLGTPTAAPPAWLVQAHPELLAVQENGQRVQFGNRCHYCVNSEALHEATKRLVGAMAASFCSRPEVIGWQIDNEYNRYCFCERCQQKFQEYLADHYGTLAALNQDWSTAYWSQTYDNWAEIPLPIGPHNPALMLEHRRFMTVSYRRFQRLQIDLLRPHLRPEVWITHNFMWWHDGYNHYEMAADLELASWDWYVGSGHMDYRESGAAHDLVRGYKKKPFWLMETQPGNVNWRKVNNVLNLGESRAAAWHAVAHGAQAVLYWQWRSAPGGQEQYHGTLLDQSSQPRPFYSEAQQLGRDLQSLGDALDNAVPQPQAAILNDFDSRWSIQAQRHHASFEYVAHMLRYYRPLAARNVGVDIIAADAPLDGYRLVIAPALVMLDEKRAAALEAFVRNGGHLVLTVRTGMKDRFNALLPLRQPGFLREAAGVEVEEYYALDQAVPVSGALFPNAASGLWAERLRALPGSAVEILAQFGPSNGWLDGQPAITRHACGKGQVTFVGVIFENPADQQALLDDIRRVSGVLPDLVTPEQVEARRLVRPDGKEVFVLINHSRQLMLAPLPWPAKDLLAGGPAQHELSLAPYGVAVLEK